jgi:hypothetical protein
MKITKEALPEFMSEPTKIGEEISITGKWVPEKINTETKFRFFNLEIPPTKAKYVKVQVRSQLKNPSWYPNTGGNSWLFVDEIILN